MTLATAGMGLQPDADICAVYPQRHQRSSRVRAFVAFLATAIGQWAASSRG